jgi:ligand-binding sensor domain-containing protein
MRLNIFLLLCILITLLSCCGQISTKTIIADKSNVKGDTVNELGNNIMIVYQDTRNNYWFGSWEEGVYRYTSPDSPGTGSRTILHFTTKSGLPDNRIEEIKEDKSGNIYFNTGKGISKFDGKNFNTLRVAGAGNEWKLEPNDLWFRQGWDSGFVYRYDGSFLHKLRPPKHPNYSDTYVVYSIYTDSKGNVWFGTNPMGVYRYNGKSIDWILENDVTELHDGPANGVRSVIEDKDGYFWFNTMYRYNVYDHNTDKKTFYNREKSIGSLDGKKDGNLNEYLSVARDANGALWFATYRDGIWRYDGKKITHYSAKDGTKDITVFSIYKDNFGKMWLGTHENGVYKFNGPTFERFKP